MMLLFGFIIFPISEHSYVLKVAKKLFIARTREVQLFKPDPRQNIEVKALSEKVKKELDLHRAIKLHKKDNICLYLSNRLGRFFPSFIWPKKSQFQKLYNKTRDKIERQLNIIKLIKNVRNQKVISKNSILTDMLKQQLKHCEKNVIDLEDTSDFDSASDMENSEDVQIDNDHIESTWNKPIDAA